MREDNIIKDVKDLIIVRNELKNTQFIGSNQMVMRTFELSGIYDWGGELTRPSQTPYQKGRGILVTAIAQNQDNLVADCVMMVSKNSSMSPLYTKTQEITDIYSGTAGVLYAYIDPLPFDIYQPKKKQWQIFLVGDNGQYAYVKVQVIANDDITLTVEQNL